MGALFSTLSSTQTIKVIDLIFSLMSWHWQIGLWTCISTLYLFSKTFFKRGGVGRPPPVLPFIGLNGQRRFYNYVYSPFKLQCNKFSINSPKVLNNTRFGHKFIFFRQVKDQFGKELPIFSWYTNNNQNHDNINLN